MRRLLYLIPVALVAYLLTGFHPVGSGERAVVRRFGRVLDEKPGPGLWVGLPWGMDRVDRVNVDRVLPVEVGYRGDDESGLTPDGQLLTGDHNLVNLRAVVNYRVRPEHVEEYVANLDGEGAARVEGLIAAAAEAALAEWVASRTVDDVLLRGKAELPAWLTESPESRLEKRLAEYRIGVQVVGVTVIELAPPDEVKPAFDEVTQAQAKIRTALYRAEQEAAAVQRRAEAERFRLLELARAYEREQRLLAEAEARTFAERLTQYRKARQDNPDVLAAMWWDRMGELFRRMKEGGGIDLLDHHLGADGLSIMQFPPRPRQRGGDVKPAP